MNLIDISKSSSDRIYKSGKIKEPGIYRNVPMDVYHSDCCAGPSISSSGLRTMTPPHGCPLKYWDDSYLNPDRAPQEQKQHFNLGKAVHTLLMSEEGFRDDYAVRPAEFDSWRTKASKEWREKAVADGKVVLEPEMIEQIEGMANRVANDRDFVDHLRGKIERSIIWQDPVTGVWLKSRPDSIPADTIIADLKTTSDASDRACQLSVLKFGYHMQFGLAGMGLEIVSGKQITDHVLLFIETKRPFAYNIKPIDNQFIHMGRRQCRASINIFAECWNKQEWPTYYGSGFTISSPDWFDKQIEHDPSIPQVA